MILNQSFRSKVALALESISSILESTKTPCFAEDVEHHYDDKYGLADFLTNTSISASMIVLCYLGLDEEKIQTLNQIEKSTKKKLVLEFRAQEKCEFIEKKKAVIEGSSEVVVTTREDEKHIKVQHNIVEYHWKLSSQYSLLACLENNNNSEQKLLLRERSSTCRIVTAGNKKSPRPSNVIHDVISIPLSWVLSKTRMTKEGKIEPLFHIDRSLESCRTPRRNEDIEEAVNFFSKMRKAIQIHDYFTRILAGGVQGQENSNIPSITPSPHSDLQSINVKNIFIPILPLFIDYNDDTTSASDANTPRSLSINDSNLLLDKMVESVKQKLQNLLHTFPCDEESTLISGSEACISLLTMLLAELSEYFLDSINHVEKMLSNQLISAIGKEIGPVDFEEFTLFHSKKLLKDEYGTKSMCYSIRREGKYPDGSLGIYSTDNANDKNKSQTPISVLTREFGGEIMSNPIELSINATTTVQLTGKRFLHSWLLHSFAGSALPSSPKIVASARQFSGYMLIIGKMTGPDSLKPEDAIIIQNKDEVVIPLILNQLPSVKQFKDAIKSLSPEQQEFASAFRQMQLESSVFAVAVVQLKPQLELLLGLPFDSLTKEIHLTQDILSLFIEYQIPSDLLKYDGDDSVSLSTKVDAVKGHVTSVMDMISKLKEKELKEETQAADMRFESTSETVFKSGQVAQRQLRATSRSMPIYRSAMTFGSAPVPMGYGSVQSETMFGSSAASSPNPPQPVAYSAFSKRVDIEANFEPFDDETSPVLPYSLERKSSKGNKPHSTSANTIDITQIPKQLEREYEKFKIESSLRPTKITTGKNWKRKASKSLLLKPELENLSSIEQEAEKRKAFELLDALSRSGSLPLSSSEIHVVVATTHCFDNSLIGTVIEDNINPMEKIEKALLVIGSTIYNVNPDRMIRGDEHKLRLAAKFPQLLEDADEDL